MSCNQCLTQERVHMIAYLTMHGWKLSYTNEWVKEGFTYKATVREHCCGGCFREVDTEYFELEQAYEAQEAAEASK